MLHKGWAVLSVLLIIGGLSMLLYPLCSGWLTENRQAEVIRTYQTDLEELSKRQLEKARTEAQAYNQQLCSIVRLSGQVMEEIAGFSYEQLLNENADGIMSYIEIPRIEVYLPVYHGTSDAVLAKGAGHMQNTSLPVGGASTHCVISAHCGDPSATLFSNLDQLQKGDMFYLHTLEEVLSYEVDQIKVVLPYETEEFRVVEGQDYVTLVTCTPYGINSHRLLVRGKRVASGVQGDSNNESIQNQVVYMVRGYFVGNSYWNAAICTEKNTERAVKTIDSSIFEWRSAESGATSRGGYAGGGMDSQSGMPAAYMGRLP